MRGVGDLSEEARSGRAMEACGAWRSRPWRGSAADGRGRSGAGRRVDEGAATPAAGKTGSTVELVEEAGAEEPEVATSSAEKNRERKGAGSRAQVRERRRMADGREKDGRRERKG